MKNILHYTCRIGKWVASVILGTVGFTLFFILLGLLMFSVDWVIHHFDWLKYLGDIIIIVVVILIIIGVSISIHEYLDEKISCPKKKR